LLETGFFSFHTAYDTSYRLRLVKVYFNAFQFSTLIFKSFGLVKAKIAVILMGFGQLVLLFLVMSARF
jgi:hypothetical protein